MWLFWKAQTFSHWWKPIPCFSKNSNLPLGTEWKFDSKVNSPLLRRSMDLFKLWAERDNLLISMICVFWKSLSFDSELLMRTTGPFVKNRLRLVWWLEKILWKVGDWYLDHLKGCADLSHRVLMTINSKMNEYESIPIRRRERGWPSCPAPERGLIHASIFSHQEGPILALIGWEHVPHKAFQFELVCSSPFYWSCTNYSIVVKWTFWKKCGNQI